jgi:hypothetical protein
MATPLTGIVTWVIAIRRFDISVARQGETIGVNRASTLFDIWSFSAVWPSAPPLS